MYVIIYRDHVLLPELAVSRFPDSKSRPPLSWPALGILGKTLNFAVFGWRAHMRRPGRKGYPYCTWVTHTEGRSVTGLMILSVWPLKLTWAEVKMCSRLTWTNSNTWLDRLLALMIGSQQHTEESPDCTDTETVTVLYFSWFTLCLSCSKMKKHHNIIRFALDLLIVILSVTTRWCHNEKWKVKEQHRWHRWSF